MMEKMIKKTIEMKFKDLKHYFFECLVEHTYIKLRNIIREFVLDKYKQYNLSKEEIDCLSKPMIMKARILIRKSMEMGYLTYYRKHVYKTTNKTENLNPIIQECKKFDYEPVILEIEPKIEEKYYYYPKK